MFRSVCSWELINCITILNICLWEGIFIAGINNGFNLGKQSHCIKSYKPKKLLKGSNVQDESRILSIKSSKFSNVDSFCFKQHPDSNRNHNVQKCASSYLDEDKENISLNSMNVLDKPNVCTQLCLLQPDLLPKDPALLQKKSLKQLGNESRNPQITILVEDTYKDVEEDITRRLPEVEKVLRASSNQEKTFYSIFVLNNNEMLVMLNSINKNGKKIPFLGKGAEGKVRVAWYIDENNKGRYVAIKKTKAIFGPVQTFGEEVRDTRNRENITLENKLFTISKIQKECALKSPYILNQLSEFKVSDKSKGYTVLPLVAGSLKDSDLVNSCFFTQAYSFVKIVKQLLSGVSTIHERGYVHRDLCLDNIMITQDGNLVIGDFGSAKQANSSGLKFTGRHDDWLSLSSCNLEDVKEFNYSQSIEVASVGVCLYKAIFGFRFSSSWDSLLDFQQEVQMILEELKAGKQLNDISVDDDYSYVKDYIGKFIDLHDLATCESLVYFLSLFFEPKPEFRLTIAQLLETLNEKFLDIPDVSVNINPNIYEPLDIDLFENSLVIIDELKSDNSNP